MIGKVDSNLLLVQYMRETHNLIIGERTAESVIEKVIDLPIDAFELIMMRGRNTVTGNPTGIELTVSELRKVLQGSDRFTER